MYGGLDAVEGMIKRIISETNYKQTNIILTGGYGSLISSKMKTPNELDQTITIYGLKLIVDKNN